MDTKKLFSTEYRTRARVVFIICVLIMVGAVVLASLVQRDFGKIEVTNVNYANYNGINIRAKLFRPLTATEDSPMPGVVYIHGYQNNRETGDAYCIELARRGFVVLNIDAIGRGNSGLPSEVEASNFDDTYGGLSSFIYLTGLPFVDHEAAGMLGHSLGAEMAYNVALANPEVKALVISGFGYGADATPSVPKNMLMIFGKWDEFRGRMTGTQNFEAEWMDSEQTQAAIAEEDPQLGETYGDFLEGTARRVFMPLTTHIQESHSRAAIAETVEWMQSALWPIRSYRMDPYDQIWPIKEWATLVAMIACFASLLPLGLILLQSDYFRALRGPVSGDYACSTRSYLRMAAVNGLLMLLYLPLILVIFAIHLFVVPIDKIFPMMMVNGIVFWFVVINLIGFYIFRRWVKKQAQQEGTTLTDLGISNNPKRFFISKGILRKSIQLAAVLFAFAYLSEYLLEALFIVDFRFIFPFASDLTPYRVWMFVLYFPFLLIGFLQVNIFLHAQLRRPQRATWLKTFTSWSSSNVAALVTPLLLMLAIQYVPIFLGGGPPFVGPGSSLVSFVLNLAHLIIVLLMMIPLSTWFYQLTGNIYTGALLNALLVTWMFVSSQVIAPIPV